jgi:hypothetical protein
VFPGRIEFLEDAPFDGDSAHLGADFFIALDPGCYTVTATPVSAIHGDEFTASCDCSTAKSDKLEVEGGYTTEVTLISQCEGDLVGAIDALVMTNTPPTVVPDIENKFNNQCETVEICATGWDPDDDPIEFDFTNLTKGHDFFDIDVGDIELVGYESGHRLWQQCAEIVTEDIADYTSRSPPTIWRTTRTATRSGSRISSTWTRTAGSRCRSTPVGRCPTRAS